MKAPGTRIRVARVGTSITLHTILRNQMRMLDEEGFEIVCVCDDDEWTPALREQGLTVWPLGMGRRPGPTHALRWAARFYHQLKSDPVDIVHTHNAFHGIAGRAAARLAGVPVVVQTVHNWWYLDKSSRLRARAYLSLERVGASLSDAVLFINHDDLARAGRQRIVPERKRHFIGNGIDVPSFDAELAKHERDAERSKLGLGPHEKAIIMVARLEPPKDHRTLLRAFARVSERLPSTRLLLVGQGLAEDEVREETRVNGLSETVSLLGHRKDVPALLRAADVVVLSSIQEGFGRCLVEGMLAGLPVVASDVVGVRDVVEHGMTGLLAAPGHPEALASALLCVLEDDDTAQRLGDAGRSAALRRFDERLPALTIASIYRALLAGSEPAIVPNAAPGTQFTQATISDGKP